MRRRVVVWFAVIATFLVVTAAPASAATVVVSENTTDEDFQTATLSDAVVTGGGTTASVEPGSANHVYHIAEFSAGNVVYSRPAEQAYGTPRTSNVSVSINGSSSSQGLIHLTESVGENSNIEVGMRIGNLQYQDETGTWQTISTVPNSDEFVDVTVFDINPATDTYRVEWSSPGGSGVSGTLPMTEPMTDGYTSSVLVTNDRVRFDDFSVEGVFSDTFDSENADSGIPDGWEPITDLENKSFTREVSTEEVEALATQSGVGTGTYVGSSHVADATSGFVDVTISGSGSLEATWQGSSDGGNSWTNVTTATHTTSGTYNSTLSGYSEYRLLAVLDAPTSSDTAKLDAEGVYIESSSPQLSGEQPEDGSQVTSYDGDVSVEVSDPDLGTAHGDTVTVVLRDSGGSVINSTTVTVNQTVEFPYNASAGSNTVSWEASDAYGSDNATLSQTFTTPSVLYIREETNTSNLINSSSNLTLRFFGGDQIVERETTDGTVDMTGLPATEEIVVVARADGYYSRRAVLTSLFAQQSIYLLSKNESAVFNEFVTEDRTGLFTGNQTRLRIEKGITQNGTTEWKTLAGDYLGAGRSFSLYLQKDARYRLFVENANGDVRNIGPHIANADGIVPVTIGQIVWEAPQGDTYKWKASLDEETNVLQFEYVDEADETTNFDVKAYVRGNESNPIFEDSASTLGTYQASQQLTENQSTKTIIVEWSASRNGEQIGDTETVGNVDGWDVPVDQRWLTSAALVLLVALAWLMPSAMARVGAVMVVAVATGMSWLGLVPIPMPVIGIAGATALIGLAAQFRS